MSSFIRDIVPWVNQPSTNKEMIENFRSHTKDAIPCLSNVKKAEHHSGVPFIKLEWCGMQCSGKYGQFIKSDNQGAGRLHSSKHSSVAQSSSHMFWSFSMHKSQATDPNAAAYSIDRLKEILDGNEIEIKWLSKMRHENIITLLGVFYEDGSGNVLPMLVMESVQCDLHQYLLDNAKMSLWNEDLTILQGISSGLMYLHEVQSIIHNRISTKSIMLTKDLVVKLSNFECSVRIDKSTNKSVFSQSSDIFLFGKVMSDILCLRYFRTHTEDDESMKQLMQSLFELCTSTQLNCRPSSYDISLALKKHKNRQVQKTKIEMLDELERLTKSKDEHFALTNDFTTTADEGSVIKLRDEYRHMQHNLRAAAMKEHKKLYDDIPLSLADHCMLAYKYAKVSLFDELKNITDRSLYQLQISENSPQDNKLSQNYLLLIKSLRDDHKLSKDIKVKIEEALIKEYKALTSQAPKGIPKSIEEYYSTLAKFSWDCVARPIPLIMSTDYTKFDKELHEAGDNVDNEGKDVSYIYPMLLTSNNWPREVALKGKVSILLPTKFLPF